MLEGFVGAAALVWNPFYLLMLLCGVTVGIVIGILPGVGGTVAMAIVLPFVFKLGEPSAALALIIGAGAVCVTSDSITAILMGVPGTVGGAATIMEGYSMAKKGLAGMALGAALTASLIGGLFGALCLTLSLPIARPLILMMGSPDFFMMSILGIIAVATLGGQSPIKGCIAAGLGMIASCVGGAPGIGVFRYTLDQPYLFSGLPLVPVALGVFAMPEIVDLLSRGTSIADVPKSVKGLWDGVRAALKNIGWVWKGSLIGAYVGVLPGMGGSVANWMAYGYAVTGSKDRSQFSKGDIRGLVAPEAANNACVGGDMIPTILFGIPGGPMMSLLLAAFMIIGIFPGREMVTKHLPVTISMIWSLALANVFSAIICFSFARPLARITRIPIDLLAPFILLTVILGAFQSTRHWGDLFTLIGFGVLGWFCKRFGYPRPSLLVGYVLGNVAEQYMHISILRYGDEWLYQPGVIIIGLLIVLTIWMSLRQNPQSSEAKTDNV
ncbi:MAG: tripartite tricarboxylate transporter permease [Thermodesulfobacteriota bacterium]|nr:tripartite tricarboxylate transporter permease [Thermodesulfobacteriota bacterium]